MVVVLTVAMVAAWGMPETGTSYAAGDIIAAPVQAKENHFAYITGYPDGEVKPLDKLSREETAVIFYRLMTEEGRSASIPATQSFIDMNADRWSYHEIAALVKANIIQGYPDGRFRPAEPITRAEFAAMAARLNKLEESKEDKYPDTEAHWAKKYINSSAGKGWIKGYGDGTFRPDNNIIRCEAMMLINDMLDRRVNIAGLHKDAKQWPDNSEDKWYYEIVMEATNTHDYERAKPKSTEKWTKITDNPVW